MYDAIQEEKTVHILKLNEIDMVVGYAITQICYPSEVMTLEPECLEDCNGITQDDLNEKIVYIEVLEIADDYRYKGFGQILFNAVKDYYKGYNIGLSSSPEAIEFWTKMGFKNTVGWSFDCPYLLFVR